jgi:hypothetical protein
MGRFAAPDQFMDQSLCGSKGMSLPCSIICASSAQSGGEILKVSKCIKQTVLNTKSQLIQNPRPDNLESMSSKYAYMVSIQLHLSHNEVRQQNFRFAAQTERLGLY